MNWHPTMSTLRRIISTVFFISLAFQCGCSIFGGGGGLKRAKGYQVAPPEGWKKVDRADSDVAYRLPTGNMVTVTSSCKRHAKAPLKVLTRHLLIGTRQVKYRKQQRIRVGKSEGLHSSVNATLEGVPFRFEFFVIKKNQCIFDFTLVSPRKISTKELGQFVSFFKSFKYGQN